MPLPRPASPRALMQDLRAFAAERSKHQWIAMFVAIAMPAAILVMFYFDGRTNIMPGEQVIFVESWSAERTDEEIRAAQEVRRKEREKAQAQRQQEWKAVADRLGMDP
ncbi:MAG TPA: hypothetical protein VGB08_03195 [Allosphingosinicella sp.]